MAFSAVVIQWTLYIGNDAYKYTANSKKVVRQKRKTLNAERAKDDGYSHK